MKTDPFVQGQSKVTLEIPLERFRRSPPTWQESKAKITSDTDQAVNALNGRIVAWNDAPVTAVPALDNCWKFTRESKWLLHSWQQYENYMFLNLKCSIQSQGVVGWVEVMQESGQIIRQPQLRSP